MKQAHHLFVFVAYGSLGDIYPLLEIAGRMKQQGHRVLFIANEYFAAVVRNAGVDYAEAGTCGEQLAARETKDSNGDTFDGAMIRYDFLIGRNYGRVRKIVEALISAEHRLLVVTHGRLSPAFPVCEQYSVPIVLAYYSPAQIPDNQEDYVLYRCSFGGNEWLARNILYPLHQIKKRVHHSPVRRYNYWRKQSGYGRISNPLTTWISGILRGRGTWLRYRHPNVMMEIALFPQWFAEPLGRDIGHIKYTGFIFHADNNPHSKDLVDEFIEKYGSPVVFTPGTAVEDVGAFCSVIADTCRKLNAPAIVLSRYLADASEKFDSANVNVLVLDHIDLGYLLPKAKLLVHHGGIGTLAQAVRAGIPQIIRPRMYDQPGNALRVAQNGVGGMLYDNGYTAEGIASIYGYLRENEMQRECLAYYSAKIRDEDGAGNAMRIIEACAESCVRSGALPALAIHDECFDAVS